jgi:protocatechuate 3,4-dioxygenase beta subunit
VSGANAQVAYTIVSEDGETVRSGEIDSGKTATEEELFHGLYYVTLTLPDGTLLSTLNDYSSLQKGQAEWVVDVQAEKTSGYELTLMLSGTMTGSMNNLSEPVQLTMTGVRMSVQTEVSGDFTIYDLVPDTYQVTAVLPRGRYDAEGWSLTETENGMTASVTVEVGEGETVELPSLTMRDTGSVSGTVLGQDGNPMSNVTVTLVNDADETVCETVTDENGAWSAEFLDYGTYLVHYDAQDGSILSGAVTVGEEPAALTAQSGGLAALSIYAFRDSNNNGSRGESEKGFSGAEISVIAEAGGVEITAASGVTDENGELTLAVPAGTYMVRCELPEGYGYGVRGKSVSAKMSIMDETTDRVQTSEPLTLAAGSVTEVGIGTFVMATLKGHIWLDTSDDGIYQDDEPGQAGVTIRATGVKNGLVYETESDENGDFIFTQLRYGTYNVEYILPDGLVFTRYSATGGSKRSIITSEFKRSATDQMIFERGETQTSLVGVVQGSDINGICFVDANHNGVYDDGEEPLAGVKVVLYRQAIGKELLNAVSDENGQFSFSNIRSSTFRIKATIPQGYVYSIEGDGETGNKFAPGNDRREYTISDVTLENNSEMTIAIGAITYGSISGTVYQDDNFSGSIDSSEKTVSGVNVTLEDDSGSKWTVKTNKNGAFTFSDLAPGQYILSAQAPDGKAFTKQGEGSVLANVSGGMGESDALTLEMGAELTDVNIGIITPGQVTGTVFADHNDNGLLDEGEEGMTGTVVYLVSENGTEESREVDASGTYLFDAVLPGTYTLRYELPEGGIFAVTSEGGNMISDGTSELLTVQTGKTVQAPLCGALVLGEISGTVYADHNGSGTRDEDETNLSGVTFILTPSRSDLEQQTIVTDDSGEFRFENLRPDTYTLTVRFPEGMVLSKLSDDCLLTLTHGLNETSAEVVIDIGTAYTLQHLGGVIPSTMSGQLYIDENSNGKYDDGELTPSGETIELLDADGEVFLTAQTDETGAFELSGIAPGTYSLSYTLADNAHSAAGGDTTFTEADGRMVMADIAVEEDSCITAPVLGLKIETTVSGSAWYDEAGEIKPVEGAEVHLLDAQDTLLQTVLSDADGLYRFDALMPGEYKLSVTMPAGYVVIEPDDARLEDGQLISVMTACSAEKGESDVFTLRMSQNQLNLNIGAVQPGTLGDFCWVDLNGNGLQDVDEKGLGNMRVELWRDGELAAETTTDAYGFYVFKNIYPGVYTLKADYPAEVKPTQQRTDFPMIASIMGENGESNEIQVASGSTTYTADLGFVPVEEGVLPENYGIGAEQDWSK